MPVQYTVKAGDCIASIGWEHGVRPDDIWNDPGNDALRARRRNGYVLAAGDVVTVPDRRPRVETIATGKRHVFRRRDVPERLHVVLLDPDSVPRSGVAFHVDVDGAVTQEGTTDADGALQVWIPPAAVNAVLRIDGEDPLPLQLGDLEPVESDDGLRERLRNLGWLEDGSDPAAALASAVTRFQLKSSMAADGAIDDALRATVREAHGS